MMSEALGGFIFFAGSAACLVVFRAYGDRSPRGQQILRRLYRLDSPIWWRNGLLVPLWAPAALLFGALFLLPRWLGVWLSLPAIDLAAVAFLASYRVPAPFLPRWLKEEIEQGITPVARPQRLDWVLFWMVLPVALAANIGLVLLIVVYHAGSSGI